MSIYINNYIIILIKDKANKNLSNQMFGFIIIYY